MSHPIPTRDYGENEYETDSVHEDGVRPGPIKKKTSFKGEWHEIKKKANQLKRMVDEPAEKAWFIKHGLPKGIHATTAKQAAINKKVSQGKETRRAEDAVHPALHAYKRTLKKKGFSDGERFHRALEFGAKQNPEYKSVKRLHNTVSDAIDKNKK